MRETPAWLRIAWLASLSAERRRVRLLFNVSAAIVIDWQIAKSIGDSVEERYSKPLDGLGRYMPEAEREPPMSAVERAEWRERLFVAQNGVCYICRRKAVEPTLDHVRPWAVCGLNVGNLLMACELCNNRKADRWPFQRELETLDLINRKMAEDGC